MFDECERILTDFEEVDMNVIVHFNSGMKYENWLEETEIEVIQKVAEGRDTGYHKVH